MSRSVDYLRNANYVIYFVDEALNNSEDELEWEDFKRNLICEINSKLKSFRDCDRYDGRETLIFLENELAEIGISEYCGLYSLSIRNKEDEFYTCNSYKSGLSNNYVYQIQKALEQALINCGVTLLDRLGTFSNGEAVYRKKRIKK